MKNLSIPELLKSKRFWVLLLTFVAYVVKDQFEIEMNVDYLAGLAALVVAGYSIEDWLVAFVTGQPLPEPTQPEPPAVG